MSLRISHGNGHNEESLVTFARRSNADSICLNEANQLVDELEKTPLYRCDHARGFEDRRATDVVNLTKNRYENLGNLSLKVSDALPAFEKVAPARTLIVSCFGHPVTAGIARGVAHLCCHPVAGPEALGGNNPKNPLVVEYKAAMTAYYQVASCLRALGYLLVITGDMQVKEGSPAASKPWGIETLLARPLRLQTKSVELDWLLYDRKLKLTDWTTVPLFDHKGFHATMEAA